MRVPRWRIDKLTQDMFDGFVEVFNNPKQDLSEKVNSLHEMEDEADERTADITEYLVRCASAEIGQSNASGVAQMIRIVSELEEISDTIYRLVKLTQRKYKKEREFTSEATEGLRDYAQLIARFITVYNEKMFQPVDRKEIDAARTLENEIGSRGKSLNKLALGRMAMPEPDIKAEILNMELNNHCEKIGNHGFNVMQCLYAMANKEEAPDNIAQPINQIIDDKKDQPEG